MFLTLFISEDKRDVFPAPAWPFDSLLLGKQDEQCLAKICMGTVNISIYHASGRMCNEEAKTRAPVLTYYVCTVSSGVGWQLKGLFTNRPSEK